MTAPPIEARPMSAMAVKFPFVCGNSAGSGVPWGAGAAVESYSWRRRFAISTGALDWSGALAWGATATGADAVSGTGSTAATGFGSSWDRKSKAGGAAGWTARAISRRCCFG